MKAADRYVKLAHSSMEEGTRSKAQSKECAEASFRQASSFFYLAAINSDLREAGPFLQKAMDQGDMINKLGLPSRSINFIEAREGFCKYSET